MERRLSYAVEMGSPCWSSRGLRPLSAKLARVSGPSALRAGDGVDLSSWCNCSRLRVRTRWLSVEEDGGWQGTDGTERWIQR